MRKELNSGKKYEKNQTNCESTSEVHEVDILAVVLKWQPQVYIQKIQNIYTSIPSLQAKEDRDLLRMNHIVIRHIIVKLQRKYAFINCKCMLISSFFVFLVYFHFSCKIQEGIQFIRLRVNRI